LSEITEYKTVNPAKPDHETRIAKIATTIEASATAFSTE
jgi:hypothetical protein